MIVFGLVTLRTDLTMNALADELSQQIAGGIEFSAKGERFESEALFTERQFLGLRLILMRGHGCYTLELMQHESIDHIAIMDDDSVDFTDYLVAILNSIDGIEAFKSPEDAGIPESPEDEII